MRSERRCTRDQRDCSILGGQRLWVCVWVGELVLAMALLLEASAAMWAAATALVLEVLECGWVAVSVQAWEA